MPDRCFKLPSCDQGHNGDISQAGEDGNLTVQISTLRRVLDNGQSEGSCIQTIPGHGYRFVGTVRRSDANAHLDNTAIVQRGARVPPRLSIVVLPIINFSSDPEQEYLADAITDDLTTDLSRIEGSFVISCNTAFTYKGRRVSANQIGAELGVRYVLEGSVQRSGSQVRINTQLIDAETDAHLWAERFERDVRDFFAFQDEITSRIAIALNLALIDAEVVRSSEHPVAFDHILRGRATRLKPASRETYREAIGLFEGALALDPQSFEARCYLANALTGRVLDNMTGTAALDLARAEDLARQASTAAPRSPLPYEAKGNVLRAQSRFDEAIPEYESALVFDRNRVGAYSHIGQCMVFTGSVDEAVPFYERAMRLSPRDPTMGIWCMRVGIVHLLRMRTNQAVSWLERARNTSPALPNVRGCLASAYALNGESEQAAAELAEARRLSGDDRFLSITQLKAVSALALPKIRSMAENTYFAGLRKAGMPE